MWRAVAACGSGMDSPVCRFLRFWMHPVLLDDERKIGGSGAGAWRLLDDEWKKIGRNSNTLELEELGGFQKSFW